eukprot:COSAG02_NODE_655_length_18811_cov_23.089515_5_plen_818_part_00
MMGGMGGGMMMGGMGGGMMMGVDTIAQSTAAASSSGTPGVVGQAEGTTWDPTKTKTDAKDDADMLISYGTMRSMQTCVGGALALFTGAMMIFFLFFDAEAIIFGISHCQNVECRRGRCVELGDSATCNCPVGYGGAACQSATISGAAYADSVVADCNILLGLTVDVTNGTALAHAQSLFDGSFAFMIADIDAFISRLPSVANLYKEVFVVVVPGDRCRGIGTDAYLPAPMVLRLLAPASSIEGDIVGPSLAVTPLSTLAWSLDTEVSHADDAVRNAFGSSGLTEYQMDAGSVNILSRRCDARCLTAYCNSVKIQNAVAVLQPFLNVESQELPAWRAIVYAISTEMVRAARAQEMILADDNSFSRIIQTAYTRLLGATPAATTGSSSFQLLFDRAVGVLTIANRGIDSVCAAADLAQGQLGTLAVTEAAQRRVRAIGPTGNDQVAGPTSIVQRIETELAAYNSGGQMNEAELTDVQDTSTFQQLVESVVLLHKTVYSASGTVVSDGYFRNCRVYVDLNRDNIWNDDEEPSTMTNDGGRYKLVIAEPGDPLSELVEPSCPVRLSQDQNPECTTSVQNRPAEHGLSGTVSDSAISPITSLEIDSGTQSADIIAQCIRSTVRNCVEALILSAQIEMTFWIMAALLDGNSCGASQNCLQSNTWSSWETLTTSAHAMMSSAGDVFLSFADADQMVELFNSVVETRAISDTGVVDVLAALVSRLNSKAALEARDLAQPIRCSVADEIVGGTCEEMAGTIDGGKAILQLLRRQALARDMRAQIADLVSRFSSEDQFRSQVISLESAQEAKLPTLGALLQELLCAS